MRLLKTIFSNVMIDNEFNYHKLGCRLFNHRFTVIQNHYGKWGALSPDQRRQIRELCDACDMFEKTADKFLKENERLKGEMANISAQTLKRFEKNIKDVKVTLGQTWEIQNAIKETLKEMVGEDK